MPSTAMQLNSIKAIQPAERRSQPPNSPGSSLSSACMYRELNSTSKSQPDTLMTQSPDTLQLSLSSACMCRELNSLRNIQPAKRMTQPSNTLGSSLSSACMCRELNSMDVALHTEAKRLLEGKLQRQAQEGVLQGLPQLSADVKAHLDRLPLKARSLQGVPGQSPVLAKPGPDLRLCMLQQVHVPAMAGPDLILSFSL